MKKRLIAMVLCGLLASLSFAGCSKANNSDFKVGMITDSGTIDDKSFNQGTWEGLLLAQEKLGVDINYLKPAGETEAEYLKEIANQYDTGHRMIVTPGYKFETAIFKAQDRYTDAKFVLIDGAPNDGAETPTTKVADNTVAVYYAEHEAGFLAGIATAVELKDAEVGFIGGMEIPAVQKFNWGFQQGIAYANASLGTKVVLKDENVVYQGTFYETAAGTQIAASMYDKGVDAIFCAAGGVGAGAIKEATERASRGENVWIIGVDVDQYAEGLYDSNGDKKVDNTDKSIILTSAMKRLADSTFELIDAALNDKFPGGQTLVLDCTTNGVGIPAKNPNLSDSTQKQVNDIEAKIKNGEITVKDHNDGSLFK